MGARSLFSHTNKLSAEENEFHQLIYQIPQLPLLLYAIQYDSNHASSCRTTLKLLQYKKKKSN